MQEYLQANKSKFHIYREKYTPKFPHIFKNSAIAPSLTPAPVKNQIAQIFPELVKRGVQSVTFHPQQNVDSNQILTPLRIGCVLSGGQAAGGHNVIVGIYQYIKRRHANSQLFGFLNGPHGIYSGKYIQILENHISYFKNRGGFDMICSGRHKIQTPQQFQKSLKYCEGLKLDGLVVIGGDDSNTNAALLAEYFLSKNSSVRVIGCPKTIDGDLKNEFVEVSFGFDTACKTYSQCIGSVMMDTLSSKKYYHFIRLMGRSASHIALECALLTRPTYTFIGEQVAQNKAKLKDIVKQLIDIIKIRSQNGKDYGVILIPEGLIEFIVQVNTLIKEINHIMAKKVLVDIQSDSIYKSIHEKLTPQSQQLLDFIPISISQQLLLDRDPHGNVQVAKIQTQKLIIQLVRKQLQNDKEYKGKFDPQFNYFGYQGRCAFPTNFDCDYCYSLGMNAAAIIQSGNTGLMSCIRHLQKSPEEWLAGGYPLITMMDLQTRKGKSVPVITKALVDLKGSLFNLFNQQRKKWAFEDYFNNIGPIQYQYKNISPYLAIPPNKENLYFSLDKEYNKLPYAKINGYNMNQLTLTLKDIVPQLPEVLSQAPELIFSENLPFKSIELIDIVQSNYDLISQASNRYIEFKNSHIRKINNVNKKIGVCFSGRQTPGGHNIISSLLRVKGTQVIGFINGTKGLFKGDFITITQQNFQFYQNQSGFHFLGRSSDKLRTQDQLAATLTTCTNLNLDGLVLIGASHTLNDALGLANYLLQHNVKTRVIGIPASIDNTVYHPKLQVSVGFASSSHLYSTLIANLMTDASSNTKYWYFIRLMGRDPSNLALQCALATHPNLVLISEQIEAKGWDVEEVVQQIVRVILQRQAKGLGFGCIIIPQGIINYLPSMKRIVKQLDDIKQTNQEQILKKLSQWTRFKYQSLPDFIRKQLRSRENTNVVALSQIETEKMFAHLVANQLKKLKIQGKYKGSFSAVCHFFGYQGRCALPNQFDRNLAQSYGKIASILIDNNITGYCPTIRGTAGPVNKWIPAAIPLIQMIGFKAHSRKYGVTIRNVHLKSRPFKNLQRHRQKWILVDHYENPGPIQFFGEMKSYVPLTLSLNNQNENKLIEEIEKDLKAIGSLCRFGIDEKQLKLAKIHLQALIKTLQIYRS